MAIFAILVMYDEFNIYTGKETEKIAGSLGGRVVTKLASNIRDSNVILCFDRFLLQLIS